MFDRLSWRQTWGYLQLAFSCLLFHLLLSSLVMGAGTDGQGFCGLRSGFIFPSLLLPVLWISFGGLWRLTRQEVYGLVGVSLQGPSGQVCSPIKHQKQPWYKSSMRSSGLEHTEMPEVSTSEHESLSWLYEHSTHSREMKLLLICHSEFYKHHNPCLKLDLNTKH